LRGDLKGETGSEIAAQNQALQTKYSVTEISQTDTGSKRRFCKQLDETMEHVTSTCPILAKEEYIKRHDTVCAEMHGNMCRETGGTIRHQTLV
jgi:hypothetical protein